MSDAVMGLTHFSETEVKESTLSEKATSYIQLWTWGFSEGMKNPNNFHHDLFDSKQEWISIIKSMK